MTARAPKKTSGITATVTIDAGKDHANEGSLGLVDGGSNTADTGDFTATVNSDEVAETGLVAAAIPAGKVIKSGLVMPKEPKSEPQRIFSQIKEEGVDPVARLMALREHDADLETLLAGVNEAFAVTKYVDQIVIASLLGNDIGFVTVDDFHKMFANLIIFRQGATKTDAIKVSRRWFEWKGRRQYLRRGVVFEPGGPLEVPNDMLNLWRGFGITPKHGDWSFMRCHIFNVVCSGNQKHFDYLIGLMAWGVQHLDRPLGVAVAFLGPQGAGKGVVARTYGKFYGKHFSHITHGEQLSGRFNAGIGKACVVFLDEAVWAGDKKGEGTLKALITEPTFQLEAKFRDPIMVENRLRIMIASNNDWAVPAGIGDRRWFVLNVANTYAGTGSPGYWNALYTELDNGGDAAMLYDLLAMDLKGFDVRAIPHTAAKAQQQILSLNGSMSWLYDILQEGEIAGKNGKIGHWDKDGLIIDKGCAYECYKDFSGQRREWKPEIKDIWSKNIRAALGPNVCETRPTVGGNRVRLFAFGPLADCRRQFELHVGAPNIEWRPEELPEPAPKNQPEDVGCELEPCEDDCFDPPDDEWEPETDPEPEDDEQD
jgi:Family of unknown function (DUF5906)